MSSETKTVSYLSTGPFNESNVTGQTSANELLQRGKTGLNVQK